MKPRKLTDKNIRDLRALAGKWQVKSKELLEKSSDTWKRLALDENDPKYLPQEDAIIYSTYEDRAKGDALMYCAVALEKILGEIE